MASSNMANKGIYEKEEGQDVCKDEGKDVIVAVVYTELVQKM